MGDVENGSASGLPQARRSKVRFPAISSSYALKQSDEQVVESHVRVWRRCTVVLGGQRVQSSVKKNRNKVCFGEERSSCLDLVIYLMEKPSDILALWFDWVLSDKADMEDKTCFLFCLGLFLRSVVFLSSPVSFILVFWKSDGGVRRMWTGKRWTSRWESIHFTLIRIYTKVT